MKKILLLAAVASFIGAQAYADDSADKAEHKKGGHHGQYMKKVDTNGDGKISKSEFLAEKERHFAKMDANGDGFLERGEMKAAREKMKKMHDKMKKKHHDSDGDDD